MFFWNSLAFSMIQCVCLVVQSCPTIFDLMEYTDHGVLQARILEWVPFPSPGDLPNWGIEPGSPTLQANSLPIETQEKPSMIQWMLAIWSLVLLPFLYPAVHLEILSSCTPKPSLKDFEQYLVSMWNECKCAVVWTLFGTAFLWDWNENWPFPVLWPVLSSKLGGILSAALSQRHLLGFENAQLDFNLSTSFIHSDAS